MAAVKTLTMAQTLAELRAKDKLEIGPLAGFHMTPEGLSTGNISLDFITHVGGYPQGGITEQFGPPSSGKTTAALQSLGKLQARIISGDRPGYVAFFDYEKSLDETYCKALGLDTKHDSFIYLQPTSFEHGANIYRRLLKTGELHMAVFDSVASMVTENELNADTGAAKVADRAKMMHQFLRQVNDPVSRTGSVLLFLNHTMKVVDTSPMGQRMAAQGIVRETQPGGTALSFYSALRISFKQMGNIKSSVTDGLTGEKEDQARQTKVRATVVKNKVGDPFSTAVLRVRWGKGFSQAFSVLDILVSYKVVKKGTGGYYTIPAEFCPGPQELKIQGEDAVIKAIESNPGWLAALEQVAQSLLDQHGAQKVDGTKYDDVGNEVDPDDIGSVDEETGEVL